MKKVSLNETEQFNNSDLCIATEYNFADKDIDVATAVINGRYPDDGFCVNTMVKEMIFVIEGSGTIFSENERISFQAGDAILIEKNKKYYWDAHCKVAMSCTPAWYPEQHKFVK